MSEHSVPMILIVEDEPKLASLVSDYLTQASYQTHILSNGLDVVDWVQHNSPQLVLLDVMLPGKDGLTLCKEIRQISNVPIFMMTARVEEIDRLLGLELGADDYICKPFSPRELVARVKSLFRRLSMTSSENESSISSAYKLDEHRQQMKVGDVVCELTHVEFQLVSTMAKDVGRIYSREQLMTHMYNDHRIVSDRTIDSHIKKLRKKLKTYFPSQEFIHSVYGAGYRFEMVNTSD